MVAPKNSSVLSPSKLQISSTIVVNAKNVWWARFSNLVWLGHQRSKVGPFPAEFDFDPPQIRPLVSSFFLVSSSQAVIFSVCTDEEKDV